MKLEINELLYHAIFFLRNSPLNQEYKVIDKIRVTKSSETTIDRTLLYLLPYICNVVDMIKCVFLLFSFLRLRHFSKHNMWLSARACDFYAFVTVCWAANKIPGVWYPSFVIPLLQKFDWLRVPNLHIQSRAKRKICLFQTSGKKALLNPPSLCVFILTTIEKCWNKCMYLYLLL